MNRSSRILALAFVATACEDFGQGLVEATLPQLVFGIDPTTYNFTTLDEMAMVVPEPDADLPANGWVSWVSH